MGNKSVIVSALLVRDWVYCIHESSLECAYEYDHCTLCGSSPTVLSIFRRIRLQGDCLEVPFSSRTKTKCWGSLKGPPLPAIYENQNQKKHKIAVNSTQAANTQRRSNSGSRRGTASQVTDGDSGNIESLKIHLKYHAESWVHYTLMIFFRIRTIFAIVSDTISSTKMSIGKHATCLGK